MRYSSLAASRRAIAPRGGLAVAASGTGTGRLGCRLRAGLPGSPLLGLLFDPQAPLIEGHLGEGVARGRGDVLAGDRQPFQERPIQAALPIVRFREPRDFGTEIVPLAFELPDQTLA